MYLLFEAITHHHGFYNSRQLFYQYVHVDLVVFDFPLNTVSFFLIKSLSIL